MKKKQIVRIVLVIAAVLFILSVISVTSQAAGLIDDTIDASNNYSKYSVDNYQLDYFVDSSWDWLPWNWGDGIGKNVMYGIYSITNLLWLFGIYISNATGYLVGEAYSLDFISDTTDAIGRNIQTLAGINENGFMPNGFYPGMLLLLILVLGIYVTYTGLIKRETTKATGALFSFFTIFILSASFIAYSTSYISRINEFSADISNAALDIGSKMTMPNSETDGKSSVDAIRDSLFEIQVKQPWMILQFGDSDIERIGAERVEALESTSPFENKGKDRIEIVKDEINDRSNDNMTITKTINRLGVTLFIFIFNLFISAFVFILTGIMIFSQILFIVFAVFLPISFLLSMIPSFNHLLKTSIMRLFNVIMMRAGITLVLTISFSLSAMVYSLTTTQPFFIVAFLQIVVFAGIYFKLGDLMGMMALNSGDSQSIGGRVMNRPKQTARKTGRNIKRIAVGALALTGLNSKRKQVKKNNETDNNKKNRSDRKENPRTKERSEPKNKPLPTKQTEERNAKNENKQVTKQKNSVNQAKDNEKQEAARKFKQSQPRGNKTRINTPENFSNNSKKTKESKRRKASTRTLDKPKRRQNNEVPRPNNSRDTNQKRNELPSNKPFKKNRPKMQPSIAAENQRVSATKQRHTLPRGQAFERKSVVSEERQTTTKKGNGLSGKGGKRR